MAVMSKENLSKKVTVLIVDDDFEIREIVRILLQREGLAVLEAPDAETALGTLEKPVDLVILDIMMPGRSGLELCTELRKTTTVPILFLTARSQDKDKAEGFARGGDDYLIKPFSSVELVYRVKALLRRCLVYQNNSQPCNLITIRTLSVNLDTGAVTQAGQKIPLTDTEYQVLRMLLVNRKKVLSARELYESVWNEPFLNLSNNTVMVHIKNLRRKLEKDGDEIIKTSWGRGYYVE